MAKETFDQVSTVMWGHNALDYSKNYLSQRAHWNDFDIREEALYYAGLAHGIRSGQIGSGASQKPSQPMIYRGMPTLGSSGNDYQHRRSQMVSYYANFGGSWAGRQPQTAPKPQSGLHPGFPSPSSKTTDMPLGVYPPNYVPYTPPGGFPWYYIGYGAIPPPAIGRDPSTGLVASTSHNLPSGTNAQQRYPDASQLYQMQMQQQLQAARRQDNMDFPSIPASQTSTGLPVPKATASPKTPYLADRQQNANTNAARAGVPGRANAFGGHSLPGGKTPLIPLTDYQVSHPCTQETSHHTTSQVPAAGLKKTSAFATTVEDPSEEDGSDEDYSRINWPSAEEESSDDADSTKSMEEWFDEEGERDISHMSKTWW